MNTPSYKFKKMICANNRDDRHKILEPIKNWLMQQISVDPMASACYASIQEAYQVNSWADNKAFKEHYLWHMMSNHDSCVSFQEIVKAKGVPIKNIAVAIKEANSEPRKAIPKKYNKIATETYAVNQHELSDVKIMVKDLQDKIPDETDIDKQLQLAELQLKTIESELKNNELKLRILELTQNPASKHDIITDMKQHIIEELREETKEDRITVRSRAVMGTNNPEVYQYNSVDLSFVKKYNSQVELSREKPTLSLNSLRNAIKNNTVYLGYRWVTVKRGETPIVLPTKDTVIKSHNTPQYIVRLNHDKTKILNAYASAKEGIDDMKRQYNIKTTLHSFNRPITTGGLQFGFYWNYFDRCSLELQSEFLSHSSLPIYIHPSGATIIKICPTTGSTIQTFHSKIDINKYCGISARKLNAILNTKEVY